MKIYTSLLVTASVFCFLGCTESKQNNGETQTASAENLETTAPANTAPTATSATVTDLNDKNPQATMEINETPTATAPVTAPGMNPPHGLPGHDCSIAVGAPLNSKGKTAPAPQTSVAPQSSAPINGPVLSVPAVPTTAPGLNPPHGQPGHDCAIAVGAPLRK